MPHPCLACHPLTCLQLSAYQQRTVAHMLAEEQAPGGSSRHLWVQLNLPNHPGAHARLQEVGTQRTACGSQRCLAFLGLPPPRFWAVCHAVPCAHRPILTAAAALLLVLQRSLPLFAQSRARCASPPARSRPSSGCTPAAALAWWRLR